ncbi:MAG: M48 family metalloprotease [Acidovorax sp.]|uniref:M48 family metalloprotease n=1 Tax=Acidovorax sp. TaxID=1872122 RepID=UPI0039E65BE7
MTTMRTTHGAGSARARRWAGLLAAVAAAALMAGCESMPKSGGLGGLGSALSAVTGGGSGGGTKFDGVLDVVQGASAAFKDYTAEEQRQLGVEFSSVLLGARPLLRNELVQRYVNQVGWWVAQQADLPTGKDGKPLQFAWRFGVIDSDAVNAYATPGGFVFVTVGLMRQLKSESELAGVLAHEVAHVVRGHYLAAIKKGGFAQMAGGVVQARAGNAAISSAMVNAVRNIYQKGLDQGDEFDADRMGMLYAARAGYAPAGLPNVLKMYAANSAQDANYNLLFSTHPAPADRIAKLTPLLGEKFAGAQGTGNEARYMEIRRQLR